VNHGGSPPFGRRIRESIEARASGIPDPGREELDQELARIMPPRPRPRTADLERRLAERRLMALEQRRLIVELHLAQASARLERADDLGREQEWEWEDLAGRRATALVLAGAAALAVAAATAVLVTHMHATILTAAAVMFMVVSAGTGAMAIAAAWRWSRWSGVFREWKGRARGRGAALRGIPDPPGWRP
jgi:hypothetical protein